MFSSSSAPFAIQMALFWSLKILSDVIISSMTDLHPSPPFLFPLLHYSPESPLCILHWATGMSLGSKTAHTFPGAPMPSRPSWSTTPSVAPASPRQVVPFGRAGAVFMVPMACWARFPQANLSLSSTSPYLSLLACSFRMLSSFCAI
jgi:hypothetical protein